MCFDWVTYLSTSTSQGDPNIEGKCEVDCIEICSNYALESFGP